MMNMKNCAKEKAGEVSETGFGTWLLLVVLGALLLGCDSVSTRFVSGLTADERVLAAQIPVYREKLPEGSYQLVGPVEGISCQITHDDRFRVSEGNAREELQRATFQMGANAVMEVSCDHLGRGQGTRRCFRSVVCQGIAVQKTSGDPN